MKKYYLLTLGCQMNYHSSDQINDLMQKLGLEQTKDKTKTDVFIVNACSVRQHAVDRIFGYFKQLKHKPLTIITGCVLPADKTRMKDKFDLILPIDDLEQLRNFLIDKFRISDLGFRISKDKILTQICPPFERPAGEKDVYYIPIMEGCDNFCSYCAVPYTRGRERSRSEKEIIADIKAAMKMGAKKIMLLGQNVNSYRKCHCEKSDAISDDEAISSFTILLQKIEKLPSNFSYNFLSSHPKDFSDSLIKFLSKSQKWERKLHLPIQSGDDEVLRKMNRHYTGNDFLKIVSDLRSNITDLYLSTDIIVGFPGETKKQFANTVSLCKKAKFDHAFIAQYSPRPGTTAAKMEDDVLKVEKKRRWEVLNKLINK